MGSFINGDDRFLEFIKRLGDKFAKKWDDDKKYEWIWDDFVRPIAEEALRLFNEAGRQDPDDPGRLRIDAGVPLDHGGLKRNSDAEIVLDFTIFEEADGKFYARYNLADELLRYAEVGEEGWDVARQIDQLERTIGKLKHEARLKGWSLPDVEKYQSVPEIDYLKPLP